MKGLKEIWRYSHNNYYNIQLLFKIPACLWEICKVAKELFDDEVEGHKAELELLNSTMEEHQSMSKQGSTKMTNITSPKTDDSLSTRASTHSKSAIDSPGSLHEVTKRVSAKSKPVTATTAERRISQFHQTLHHNQDHLFAKLADKDHQLKSAKEELAETRNLVQDMENELEKLKRENAELVKLQGMITILLAPAGMRASSHQTLTN